MDILTHHDPTVGILLATYQGERFLAEQLNSIFAQSFKDFHLYVSDDCSHDRSVQIIQAYQERYSGKITLFQHEYNSGSAKDNFLFFFAQDLQSPYYVLCDQDDVWHQDKLRLMVEELQKLEAEHLPTVPLLCYSDYQVVDSQGNVLKTISIPDVQSPMHRFFHNNIPGCCMAFSKALFDLVSQDIPCDMHDWLLVVLAANLGAISHIPQALTFYRQHAGNTVGERDRTVMDKCVAFLRNRSNRKVYYQNVCSQLIHFAMTFGDEIEPNTRKDLAVVLECGVFVRFRTIFRLLRFPGKNHLLYRMYETAMIFHTFNSLNA